MAKPATNVQADAPPSTVPATELNSQLEIVSKALVQIDAVSAGIAQLRAKYQGVLFEVATTKGMKEACEARAEIREPRYEVEKLRKAAKRPILDLGKKLDTEAERITNELLAIEGPVDQQITAEQKRKEDEKRAKEEAERARIAALQARVDELRQLPLEATGLDSQGIESLIKKVVDTLIDDSFCELKQQAEGAKATSLIRLRAALTKALAMEAEQNRLAEEREKLRIQTALEEARQAAEREQIAEAQARLAEEERVAREGREAEADKQRIASTLHNSRMSEIHGIAHQVIIAQVGRLGVRKGGTIECIRETLAETERWPIEESSFGPLTEMAQRAKDTAVNSINELLIAAEAKAQAAAALQARIDAQKAEEVRLEVERQEQARQQAEADAARRAETQRLADERAQLERDQEALRVAQERAAAPVVVDEPEPESGSVAEVAEEAPFRPSDEAIIHVLTTTYNVSKSIVITWLASMDLRKQLEGAAA